MLRRQILRVCAALLLVAVVGLTVFVPIAGAWSETYVHPQCAPPGSPDSLAGIRSASTSCMGEIVPTLTFYMGTTLQRPDLSIYGYQWANGGYMDYTGSNSYGRAECRVGFNDLYDPYIDECYTGYV